MRTLYRGLPFAICLILLLQACEQTVDVDLPYERAIVINTFVGRSIDSLAWVSRTLQATQEATFANAAILDAVVTLQWRDTVYQLQPLTQKRGFVLPPPDPRWQGDSMRMIVEWQGLRAESVARMPIAPTVEKTELVASVDQPEYRVVRVTLLTRPGSVIWVQYVSRFDDFNTADPPLSMYEYYRVVSGNPSDPEVTLVIDFTNYYIGRGSGSVDILVCAADAAYAKFLDEPNRNSDDPFSFGGASSFTNVTGKGFGMFVPVVSVAATVVID
ncbi:MAG: hypothetical protein SGJ20_14925 [Planctomycetota bacterium]|nr:hypothetical protein [Planctomycetota bacterium]